jgi:hypothetical protein
VGRLYNVLVLVPYPPDARLVRGGERFEAGCSHAPLPPGEPSNVLGSNVIVHHADLWPLRGLYSIAGGF